MVPAKFFKVQVVAVVQLSQGVLMQLAEVISLTKSVVGKLPVQVHFDGFLTHKLVPGDVVGGKFRGQFWT